MILDQANSVEYVSQEYYETETIVWWKPLGHCWLSYNGERRGGTAATVRYARKLGRRIIILNPITLKTVEEGG